MYSVTVIVPVYNVREYVQECLCSVLNQTYTNLEVLVIDDGSTDGSLEICRQTVQEDARVTIVSQPNGGLSAARNAGLVRATGHYIYFVDSDDRLAPDAIERLYEQVRIHGEVDVVSGQFRTIGVAGEKVFEHYFTLPPGSTLAPGQMLSGSQAYELYFASKTIYSQPYITNNAQGKLWRRELLQNFSFPNLHFEDLATTYRLLAAASTVVITDEKGYEYRSRPGSIMNSGTPAYLLDLHTIWRQILSFTEQTYPHLAPVVAYRAYLELMHWSLERLSGEHPYAQLFYREAQSYLGQAKLYRQKQRRLLAEGYLGFHLTKAKRRLLKKLKSRIV